MDELISHPIFNSHPSLKQQWITLIDQPTPVARLESLGSEIGHANLFVKREDLTALGYGGNKVRNLEFLLGRARHLGYSRVAMVAPMGSNFVAAAASQAARIGMNSEFFHFVPAQNRQIQQHARFTQSTGAHLHINGGAIVPAIVKSSLGLSLRLSQNFRTLEKTFHLPMGGSDPIGSLGHVNAALELAMQIRQGDIPPIDHLVVGVGTCGTMAGLLVGLRMANLPINLIGVRCVDRILCNEKRIARLANQIAKSLRLNFSFSSSEINLRDCTAYDGAGGPSAVHYGKQLPQAEDLISQMQKTEQITLDTTYTTKVVHYLTNWIKNEPFQTRRKNILYWHTFSPTAMTFMEASPLSAASTR